MYHHSLPLLLQVIAVLCDRNAIEIKRYGHPMGFSKTPKMTLIQAVCGRGGLYCGMHDGCCSSSFDKASVVRVQ